MVWRQLGCRCNHASPLCENERPKMVWRQLGCRCNHASPLCENERPKMVRRKRGERCHCQRDEHHHVARRRVGRAKKEGDFRRSLRGRPERGAAIIHTWTRGSPRTGTGSPAQPLSKCELQVPPIALYTVEILLSIQGVSLTRAPHTVPNAGPARSEILAGRRRTQPGCPQQEQT